MAGTRSVSTGIGGSSSSGRMHAASARPARRRARRGRRPSRPLALLASLFGDGTAEANAQFRQAALFAGLVLLCAALSVVHAGSIARPFYALAALGIAYRYWRARAPWLLVTWTLWLWALTPLIRRLAEWHSGFNGHDPILAVPNVACVFMLPDIVTSRTLGQRRTIVAGLGLVLPILYGFLNSLFRGDVSSAAIAAADWVIPVFYYLFIAVHGQRIGAFYSHLRAFLGVSAAVIVPYGLYQFLFMTPWDQLWLDNSGLVATNQIANPTENRVFGTFNNAGFLALWAGWSVLLSTRFFTPIQVVLAPLGLFLLIVTLSRSVLLSTTLAFVLLLLVAPPRNILKNLVMAAFGVGLVAGMISVINPDVAVRVTGRITSMTHLSSDTSANVREGIWAETPGLIAATPFGDGIGAVGRGAAAQQGGSQVVDSGVLGAYLAFGWVFGSLYLASLLGLSGLVLLRARLTGSREAAAASCAAIVVVGITPFIAINGFPAAILWIALAVASESIGQAGRRTAARRPFDPGVPARRSPRRPSGARHA